MSLIGKKIGPYLVLEEIGRGGMGIVFKARHEKLGRLVALKMLAPHLSSNPTMRARFLREAKLQANLVHPNVVNIFDYLEEENNAFLVMEYVPGQTLEQMLLKKKRFSIPEVLFVAEGVLEALSFMHKKGIIHRDIKPSNIIVAENGLIKVTDFGIARLVEEPSITQAGGKIGTLFYLAPELIKEGKLSPAADIYSLGVTLFQLLTGQVPFTGKTEYEIIKGHLEKPPPPIQKLNPEVPVTLVKVIEKALSKKPEDRFSSADELLQVIKDLKEKILSSHKPKTFVEPPKFSIQTSFLLEKVKIYWWLGLVAFVLILAIAFWVWHSQKRKPHIIPASLPGNMAGGGSIGPGRHLPIPLTEINTSPLDLVPSPGKNEEKSIHKPSPRSFKKSAKLKSESIQKRKPSKTKETIKKESGGWSIRK